MITEKTLMDKTDNNNNIRRTDKFKVSGSAPITNQSGTLHPIRGAVSQLVGNHARQEFEEFKVALKTADFIEIDGKLVWDRAAEEGIPDDPEGEWSPEAKQKFEQVKKAFLDFSGFNPKQTIELQTLLEGLNRDLARHAQFTLTENYKFDNKDYVFCFHYPPSPIVTLKLQRNDLLFTYKLTTQSRVLGTGGTDFFKLNFNGKLKKIATPADNSGQTLCELALVAELDLSGFPKQKQATFEIVISSTLYPRFQYVGSSWAPEIMQLENSDKAPSFSKFPTAAIQETSFIIDTLQKTDIKIGTLVEKIISTHTTYHSDGLSLISWSLDLFNQAMKHALLKNTKKDLFINSENNLKGLLVTALHTNDPINFIAITKDTLVATFRILEKDKIIKLTELFFEEENISETLASARFLSDSPSSYLEQEEYITDERSLSCMANLIYAAIVTIQSALETIRQEENLPTKNFNKATTSLITHIGEVSPLFKQYLLAAIKNNLENNPFSEQLIDPKFSESLKRSLQDPRHEDLLATKAPTIVTQMLLSKFIADVEIGRTLQNIILCNPEGKPNQLLKLTSFILCLFNQIMMDILLKNKIAGIEDKDLEVNTYENVSLKQLIYTTLKEYQSFDLLGIMQKEFEKIFRILDDKDITFYLQVFNSKFIEEIKTSGLFVNNSPALQEKYPANNLILKAINFISSALTTVSETRHISLFEFRLARIVNREKELYDFFAKYLNIKALGDKGSPIYDQLLIDSKLLARIEKFSTPEAMGEDELVYQVVSAKFPPRKEKMKFCADPEKTAALWTRHPYIEGINDGFMIRLSVQQFLTLYPHVSTTAHPFLIFCDIAGGLTGALIARQDILHPKQPLNSFVRIWKASTNGLVVGIFSLGCAINTYLYMHPDADQVSNTVFWSKLAPPAIIAFLSYTAWYSIPPVVKEKWFPHNSRYRYIENTLDTSARTLFYSGIINIFLLNFLRKPGELVHQFVPMIPGLLVALLHQTRFKERANWMMTYLIAASLTSLLIGESVEELQNGKGNNFLIGSTSVQLSFWFFSLFFWTTYVVRNSISFTTEYEGDPEIITRAIPKSRVAEIGSTITMSQRDYQRFRELKTVRSEKRQEIIQQTTPLLFSYEDRIIRRLSSRDEENAGATQEIKKKSYFNG